MTGTSQEDKTLKQSRVKWEEKTSYDLIFVYVYYYWVMEKRKVKVVK